MVNGEVLLLQGMCGFWNLKKAKHNGGKEAKLLLVHNLLINRCFCHSEGGTRMLVASAQGYNSGYSLALYTSFVNMEGCGKGLDPGLTV
jgi:hypothetical protein